MLQPHPHSFAAVPSLAAAQTATALSRAVCMADCGGDIWKLDHTNGASPQGVVEFRGLGEITAISQLSTYEDMHRASLMLRQKEARFPKACGEADTATNPKHKTQENSLSATRL